MGKKLLESPNRWDIDSRSRTSAFAWRGQFTPDLVSLFFDEFDPGFGLVLDPFMGSGTVILEALRHGRDSIGVEINPAAFLLAEVFSLANTPTIQRQQQLDQLSSLVKSHVELVCKNDPQEALLVFAEQTKQIDDLALATLASALVLLSAKNSNAITPVSLSKGMAQLSSVYLELPVTNAACSIRRSDSRQLALENASVGFVVTSPPYINVFNYHQNYRPSVEALGWDVLVSAQAEIGANRKHRQNRLLTVTQYALDMSLFLMELSRVVALGGRAILVIGRESNVRGLAFKNSELIEECLSSFQDFAISERHHRKFTSRFGAVVYEEILVLEKVESLITSNRDLVLAKAREAAAEALSAWKPLVDGDILIDLQDALDKVETVQPSPLRL